MNPFGWLRRKAAEAVALGVADGLAAVTPDGDDAPPDLAILRQLAAGAAHPKALPESEETTGRRRAKP